MVAESVCALLVLLAQAHKILGAFRHGCACSRDRGYQPDAFLEHVLCVQYVYHALTSDRGALLGGELRDLFTGHHEIRSDIENIIIRA